MSRVDFYAVPHRAELREELQQAFHELNLEDVQEIEPVADDALLGVSFPDGLRETEIEARAENLRTALAAILSGGPAVSFKLAAG